jgi:tetratricopeptide (TPR) repeat protein
MQTVRSPRTAAVSLLLLACLARPAAAASGKDAKRIYEEATAAFGLGKYAVAAEKYEAAFAIRPDPALLYNAAQSYRLAGNKPRALELYRNYVRLYPDGSNANDARTHVVALKKEIEEERQPPPAPALAPGQATPVAPLPPAMPPPVESLPPAPIPAAAPPAPASGSGVPMLTGSAAPRQEQRPLTQKVWFWVAVGGGAVVLTTVLLLATRSESFPDATFGTVTGN